MMDNDEGKSPNIGKIVITISKYQEKAAGQVNVWRCRVANPNDKIISYHGAVSDEGDFLEHWLEVIPPEPLAVKETEKIKELVE